MRRGLARWRELAALHALDRAKRMVRNGHDLKAERQHVPIEPGLDNLARIRVVVPAMVKATLQKARNTAQRLQEGRHAQIIERNRHRSTCLSVWRRSAKQCA